jgi:hypothetical protein
MKGKRDLLQRYGISYRSESKKPSKLLEGLDIDMSIVDGLHTSWVEAQSTDKYMTLTYPGFATFSGSNTRDYRCLASAVSEIGVRGDESEQKNLCWYFSDNVFKGVLDEGGVIDTVPFVALLRENICYDFLVYLLFTTHNPVIEEKISSIFKWVKYKKANGALLKVIKRNNLASRTALTALAYNGDGKSANELISLHGAGFFNDIAIRDLADTLVRSSPKLSIEYFHENANSDMKTRRELAYNIMSVMKQTISALRMPSNEEILAGLRDADPDLRIEYLQVLGRAWRNGQLDVDDPTTQEIIDVRLIDEDPRVRKATRELVVEFDRFEFASELVHQLEELNNSFQHQNRELDPNYEVQQSEASDLMWSLARLKHVESIDLILKVHSNPQYKYVLFTDGPLIELGVEAVPEKVRSLLAKKASWASEGSDRRNNWRYSALCRVALAYNDDASLPYLLKLFDGGTSQEVISDLLFWAYDQANDSYDQKRAFLLGLKPAAEKALRFPSANVRLRAMQLLSALAKDDTELKRLRKIGRLDPDLEIRSYAERLSSE